MLAKLCDFHGGQIDETEPYHRILIDPPSDILDLAARDKWIEANMKDCCDDCFRSQIILSEQRRVRKSRKRTKRVRKTAEVQPQ